MFSHAKRLHNTARVSEPNPALIAGLAPMAVLGVTLS